MPRVIDLCVYDCNHGNLSPQNVSCVVSFSRYGSAWPLVGQIVSAERRRVESVEKDCREFLFMNLHYEHLGSVNPDMDYLPLTVHLLDPAVSDEVSRRGWIQIGSDRPQRGPF